MGTLQRFNLRDDHASVAFDCLTLRPEGDHPVPLCLFLFGGGGQVENLSDLRPSIESAWAVGDLLPLCIACVEVPPFCFYLDDAERGWQFETRIAVDAPRALRDHVALSDRQGLVGISMGGYGALKIAFSRPNTFHAVSATAPMLEPSLDATTSPLRNRYFYPPEVPARLLGKDRDATLFAADHPAQRAERNASELSQLAIRLEAGSDDALSAHDGAEFHHRVLWDLDVPHEYHLLRHGDHVGSSVAPRLIEAFSWVARALHEEADRHDPVAQQLRQMLTPARNAAASDDSELERVYGRLRGYSR
ncbi:MAG: hypothetical protein H6718_06190 [Polyangiaceae bacterium]|nr:hypothetical protein [Myxococcales bacterium]MCB9584967.1 hypothetical protein [Polyangiaceae bacterium]MCB9607460.1 hypothetical protein [Polyangiaceae bacterium]